MPAPLGDFTEEAPEGASQKWRAVGDGTHAKQIAVGMPRAAFALVVAQNASLSPKLDLAGKCAARIDLPADIGTATSLTFQVSDDDVTYRDLYTPLGAEYTIANIAAGRSYLLDVNDFASVRFLKVRFGSASAPNAYATAARTIKVTGV